MRRQNRGILAEQGELKREHGPVHPNGAATKAEMSSREERQQKGRTLPGKDQSLDGSQHMVFQGVPRCRGSRGHSQLAIDRAHVEIDRD